MKIKDYITIDNVYKITVCLLLAGILATQIYGIVHKPPTYGDLVNAPADKKKEIILKSPLIRSHFSEPIQVEVENEPTVNIAPNF